MSSHHFVKEGQEPALLILDALTFDVVGPLLEWAPLVVVAERAIDDVLVWNIKMDVVLTEETRVVELTHKLIDQAPLRILSHTREESPLINALYLLIREKQVAVNVISSDTERTIGVVERFSDQLQINVIDGQTKWSAIANGLFEKWVPAGTTLSVRRGSPLQHIDFKGLSTVDDYFQSPDDGLIQVRSETLFWVGEEFHPQP